MIHSRNWPHSKIPVDGRSEVRIEKSEVTLDLVSTTTLADDLTAGGRLSQTLYCRRFSVPSNDRPPPTTRIQLYMRRFISSLSVTMTTAV